MTRLGIIMREQPRCAHWPSSCRVTWPVRSIRRTTWRIALPSIFKFVKCPSSPFVPLSLTHCVSSIRECKCWFEIILIYSNHDHSRFQESALSYVRMTNELHDLRSALLLEQAAYCYLMCSPAALVRKYAFHIILSGYRFSKSGQKKHSSRAYRQGFQVSFAADQACRFLKIFL